MYYSGNIQTPNALLRVTTAGSVDDGKSTLIGRLLLESGSVYKDQLEAVKRTSQKRGLNFIDLSLLTDGLAAEREQNITIDVAYRYLYWNETKIIIADVPGHEQYTRNMVTSASLADLAIILLDARKGLLPQTKRHLYITSLLGIPEIVLAINKMDAVNFRKAVYDKIVENCQGFAKLLPRQKLQFVPVSALQGDMIVRRKKNLNWYSGPTVAEYLCSARPAARIKTALRLPIQLSIRPNMDFRGYAGQISGGSLHVGQEIMVLPQKNRARVHSILSAGKSVPSADHLKAVTITLDRELDVSRGDMIVDPVDPPQLNDRIRATICWLDANFVESGKTYLLKQATKTTRITINAIENKIDIENLKPLAAQKLSTNEIGTIRLSSHTPLVFDSYQTNRFTGSFILIDEFTKNTAGAGLIETADHN